MNLGPDHVGKLQLKVNCRLKLNCRKKFGLAWPTVLADQPKFFSTIHFTFSLQFTFSCNSLVHDLALKNILTIIFFVVFFKTKNENHLNVNTLPPQIHHQFIRPGQGG